jgi:cytochrome c1
MRKAVLPNGTAPSFAVHRPLSGWYLPPSSQSAARAAGPAPSFRIIAKKRGTNADSLRNFLLTTHTILAEPANMPNPQLTKDQVTQLVSYILSLRSSLPAQKH